MFADTNLHNDGRFIEFAEKCTVATQIAIDSKLLRPSIESIARYLGGADYVLPPKKRQRVDVGIEAVIEMVAPQATYRVVSAGQIRTAFDALGLEGDSPFDTGDIPAPYVGIFLATMGDSLEIACRSMADQNKFYQSMLFDAVGTAMLDIMGAKLEAHVEEEARRIGLYAGCRVGPGLNGMALESQALLFKLLEGHELGIRLNDAYIMEPTKTISAFILLDSEAKRGDQGHKCSRCKLKDCQFRTKPK